MIGYRFEITCPFDGAPVEPSAGGTTNGWQTRAIARCTECGTQLLVAVVLQAPNGGRRMTPARRAQLAQARAVSHQKETVPCP